MEKWSQIVHKTLLGVQGVSGVYGVCDPLITAHKRSLRRLCFYTRLSVHRGGWGGGIPACLAGLQDGGCVSQNALHGSRPKPRGSLRGLAWGVSRPTPRGVWLTPRGEGAPGPHQEGVCVSQHALRQIPPHTADGYCCGWHASYWNVFLFDGHSQKGNDNVASSSI